jgi:8-oxo-dGTP pyrophosphatase MutT (NUDIX family)
MADSLIPRLLDSNTTQQAIGLLAERLSADLPGWKAQIKMAPLWRIQEMARNPVFPTDAKVACVLALLHLQDGVWKIILMERTVNPRDRHSGQVSFPGGRYEESDGDLVNVAIREAEEEIGVAAAHIRIAGQLTSLYIPVSNFLVHPFIGILDLDQPEFRLQTGEVEQLLMPPVHWLAHPDAIKTTDVTAGNGMPLKDVPYFDIEGRVVWGATAMILSEFLSL